MSYITVNINWWFERCEPDCSQCYGCGETCYLTQWAMVLFVDGKRQDSCEPLNLCDTCHEIYMEGGIPE